MQYVVAWVIFWSIAPAFSQTPSATPPAPRLERFQINGAFQIGVNNLFVTLQRDAAGALNGLDMRHKGEQTISDEPRPTKRCVETLTLTLKGKIAANEAFKIGPDGTNRLQFTQTCNGEPLVTHDLIGTAKVTELPAPDEAGILGVYVDAKSTTGKVGKGTIQAVVYDAKTKRCPEPYTEFCYMRGMEHLAYNDVKSAELLFGLTCDSQSRDSQSRDSQSIPGCMLLSRIWAARGQTDEARDLRRKACAAQPEMCWRMSTTNMFMDAATVADLTPILCKLHNTYSGYQKYQLGPMCRLGDNINVAKWSASLSERYKAYESRLATIRAANRGKPVKLDILANPAQWKKFSRELSSQKFPVRVRFAISGVDSNPMPADFDARYGQLIHSDFMLRIPPDNASREGFKGLLCADLPTLLKLSVQYPSTGGFQSAAVTGTIIGFRRVGSHDDPVFVLD
ncbi:hypothetical protein EBZ80_18830 [bacterium]|nr:hypothetical protein [bacterium]